MINEIKGIPIDLSLNLTTIVIFSSFLLSCVNFFYSLIYKDFFLQPKIYGKLINYTYFSPLGQYQYEQPDNNGYLFMKPIKGIQYVLKLSLIVSNKSFAFKTIKIKCKFLNEDKIYEGIIFVSPHFTVTTNIGETLTIDIPQEELLPFMNYFEKDKNIIAFLPFMIEDNSFNKDDYNKFIIQLSNVDIYFYDYNDQYKVLNLNCKDFEWNLAYWEKRLFKHQ